MTVIIKKISKDEIIVSAVKLLHTKERRYVKIDTDIWYNKDLHKYVSYKDFDIINAKDLIWGKH